MRGRKRLPTHLKLITGSHNVPPAKRAGTEAKVAPGIPDPPAELSPEAREEWDRTSRRLYACGLLTGIDGSVLAAYCQAYGRWVTAERVLAEMAARDAVTRGLLVKTVNGNAMQNPLVGIANKAMGDMVRYAVEFGMSPSSRSRVRAEPRANADDTEHFFR